MLIIIINNNKYSCKQQCRGHAHQRQSEELSIAWSIRITVEISNWSHFKIIVVQMAENHLKLLVIWLKYFSLLTNRWHRYQIDVVCSVWGDNGTHKVWCQYAKALQRYRLKCHFGIMPQIRCCGMWKLFSLSSQNP